MLAQYGSLPCVVIYSYDVVGKKNPLDYISVTGMFGNMSGNREKC